MSNKAKGKLLIVLTILLVLAVAGVYHTVMNRPLETTITGWPDSLDCIGDEETRISISVEPLTDRVIELQKYNDVSGDWETISSFESEDIIISGADRDKMTTEWRVYVPERGRASEAASNILTLTSINMEEIDLAAHSACIYRVEGDGKGTVVYGKDENEKLAQASTTKLMTAVLLIESGKLEDTTTISKKAASTKEIYRKLKAGDVYSNHDLLYALMLPSANDAAVAIAEGVSGDTGTFVDMMNERARQLGLTKTCFKNPHGLDQEGHYSTAVDVAILTAFAYNFPDIRESWTYKTKAITSRKKGRTWNLKSTTKILGYDENFKGGKTGTQPIAGYCFTGVYEYEDGIYVTVVLDCGSEDARWEDTKKLHQYIVKYAG